VVAVDDHEHGQDPETPDADAAVEAADADQDATGAGDEPAPEAFERPIDRFRRTAGGSVVAAGLLGLADALEARPPKEEVTVVSEAPAQPRRDDFDLVLDPEHPERSVVYLRRPPGDDPAPG